MRKYKPYYTVYSLEEFENCNAEWYEVNHSGRKMWHRSALESLQVRTLMNWLYHGDIQACKRIEDIEESKPLSPMMEYWSNELLKLIEVEIK